VILLVALYLMHIHQYTTFILIPIVDILQPLLSSLEWLFATTRCRYSRQ